MTILRHLGITLGAFAILAIALLIVLAAVALIAGMASQS